MPPKSVRSLLGTTGRNSCSRFLEVHIMETEILGIILGAVLPIYPILFVIHQKIGRYDEVVEEFKRLQDEHEHVKEAYHGS
jgi:hypothetical protein